MDLLSLYQYFAQFVPIEVLKRNHVSGAEPDAGAQQLHVDTLSLESDRRLATITDYLFLGDQDSVLERLRQSDGQLLFVDSDRLDYRSHTDGGVALSLGVTIAEHYNQSNTDVVSELVIQNRCLETLKYIIRCLESDSDESCPSCLHLLDTAEVRFFDARQLNGLIGYTAFLTLAGSDYDPLPAAVVSLEAARYSSLSEVIRQIILAAIAAPSANINEILSLVSDVAQETNATANKESVIAAIRNIVLPTDYAKQATAKTILLHLFKPQYIVVTVPELGLSSLFLNFQTINGLRYVQYGDGTYYVSVEGYPEIGDEVIVKEDGVSASDRTYQGVIKAEAASPLLTNLASLVGTSTDTASAQTVFGKLAGILSAVGNIDFSTLAKQGSNINATNTAILDALSHISPTDPNSSALAQFFGVTLLEGYEFMTDTEVCGELEDIMQVIDPNLTAEQAAAITEQTLNPSES